MKRILYVVTVVMVSIVISVVMGIAAAELVFPELPFDPTAGQNALDFSRNEQDRNLKAGNLFLGVTLSGTVVWTGLGLWLIRRKSG